MALGAVITKRYYLSILFSSSGHKTQVCLDTLSKLHECTMLFECVPNYNYMIEHSKHINNCITQRTLNLNNLAMQYLTKPHSPYANKNARSTVVTIWIPHS